MGLANKHQSRWWQLGLAILFALVALTGCTSQQNKQETLFTQLGGHQGIEQLVDGLLHEIAADDRIVHYFRDVDVGLFRKRLIEHFCEVSDGPCHYSGATMVEAHKNLGINSADFNALVEDLMQVMKEQRISIAHQNRLLARLAPMYRDVVEQ